MAGVPSSSWLDEDAQAFDGAAGRSCSGEASGTGSIACSIVMVEPNNSSASSAAKPARSQLPSWPQPPESTSLTLPDVAARLHESALQPDAEGMLADIAVLQKG